MAKTDWSWKLTQGYSRLIEGARIELEWREAPAVLELDAAPLALAKRKGFQRAAFTVKRPFRGIGLGGRWLIRPGASIVARLLFPGNAFLGNFRVPEGHLAVQWDVEVEAQASMGRKGMRSLIHFQAGSRIKHSWVEVFEGFPQPRMALRGAWENFVDPLDPTKLSQAGNRQVIRISGNGFLSLDFSVAWRLLQGWTVPSVPANRLARVGANLEAGASLGVRVQEKGGFHVQISRDRAKLDLSVRRSREHSAALELFAGVKAARSLRIRKLGKLKPTWAKAFLDPVGGPLVQQANRLINRSLLRRLETGLRLETERSKRSSILLKASWKQVGGLDFQEQYSALLSGRLPGQTGGLRLRGVFENVRSRDQTIKIHFMNWIHLASSRHRKDYRRLTLTPDGSLVVENGLLLEKRSQRWEQIQFLRLILSEQDPGPTTVRWSFGRAGRMSQRTLEALLQMGLHAGLISDFVLPRLFHSRLQADLLLVTEFTPTGLLAVRRAGRNQVWNAIVRSFELAHPEQYKPGGYGRDWMDREAVREIVERDPLRAHLPGGYPGSARTDFQRRQVVSTYRKVRSFQRILMLWREGEREEIAGFLPLGLEIPIFLFFHLLCPPRERRSAGLLSGSFNQTWGDLGLLRSE